MNASEYYRWLKKEWAKVGVILSIYLFVILFVFVRKYDFVVFALLLQTPLYMLHQTEEYIFPGGFGKFFNTKIFNLETEDKPVDENIPVGLWSIFYLLDQGLIKNFFLNFHFVIGLAVNAILPVLGTVLYGQIAQRLPPPVSVALQEHKDS